MRIQVTTGGLSRRVTASSPEEAVKVFLLKYQPRVTGVIASCVSRELDDIYYVHVPRVLAQLCVPHRLKDPHARSI